MQVNLHEAKAKLSSLVERAIKGEEIIVAKAGKPLAKLIPFSQPSEKRPFGLLAGKISMSESFNDEDSELNDSFYEDAL